MLRNIVQRICLTENRILLIRNKNTAVITKEFDLEDIEDTSEVPDETQQNEEEIEQKRNKSRLRSQHYNILHNKAPYPEPFNDFHKTVKYQRKLYGAYGETSGVDPKICWPSAEDIANIQEYEKYKYPKTIQKMMQENEQKKKEFEEQRIKRQEDVAKKFAKLEQWKKELRDKVAKKESEARAIKERKDRLVEEVRRHFGFKIDPRDERFKEMLEQKEKAEKKAMKEAKRKVKEARMIAKLQENKTDETKETPKLSSESS